MITIRQVTAAEASLLPQLCDLLTDIVHHGASVGFLAPLAPATARHYWEQIMQGLGAGLQLWVAEAEGRVVGSVQLAPSLKENGRHRAEIQKMIVRSDWRGQRIATRLLAAAETHARALGCTTLVLDTEADSLAEAVYQHLGWQRVGKIPDYATQTDGRLIATVVYYKLLQQVIG